MINLKNGYAIERPDKLNFVLKHYEDVKKYLKDDEGNTIKEEDVDGKLKAKTYTVKEWVHCGYYGTIKGLLNGMVNHKAHDKDIQTLEELIKSLEATIVQASNELKDYVIPKES